MWREGGRGNLFKKPFMKKTNTFSNIDKHFCEKKPYKTSFVIFLHKTFG
jgi:hypothetical protein